MNLVFGFLFKKLSSFGNAPNAGRDINIDNFKIRHKADKTTLKISESILIRKFDPDLNNRFLY